MSQPRGPRIVWKDDRDSGIGRGCITYAAHLREEIIAMPRAAALTAPALIDNTMVVSEGWRDDRDSRDLHEEARAWDISLNQLAGTDGWSARKRIGELWAERIRLELGPDYQVFVHGEGANLHIHIELDP